MYFIVLGAGEVGIRVALILSNEGHEVVLIEKERARVSHVYNRIDCRLIIDEGTRSQVLEDAEIHRADYFIAVTNSDEINLVTSILVKKMAPHVKNIARLRNPQYMQNSEEIESAFSVDYVINPERAAALSIIRSIEYGGGAGDVFTFKNFSSIMVRNYFIDSGSPLIGSKLKSLEQSHIIPQEYFLDFLIALISRKNEVIIPTGDSEFQEGDEVFFVGTADVLEDLFLSLGKTMKAAKNIRKIIIIGASPVANQILDCYYNMHYNKLFSIIGKKRFATREITVIEEDLKKCEEFSDKYPDITVLNVNVDEEDVLEDLDIKQADMIIATTALQERNLVLAAHSHYLGVEHSIALVQTPVYFNIAAELGVGMSLSVRSAVVSSITNFLRGQTALYSLVEGSYGILECDVSKNSKVVNMPINEIVMPPKSLILCTSNSSGCTISRGNTIIAPNDRLLCIAHPDSFEKLNNLFSPANTSEQDESYIQ